MNGSLTVTLKKLVIVPVSVMYHLESFFVFESLNIAFPCKTSKLMRFLGFCLFLVAFTVLFVVGVAAAVVVAVVVVVVVVAVIVVVAVVIVVVVVVVVTAAAAAAAVFTCVSDIFVIVFSFL